MKRSQKPQKLGDVLGEWIKAMGLSGPLARGVVIAKWEEIMSDSMKSHIEKTWMKGDKLFVRVRSAAWRQELHLRREEWRKRLNAEVGSEAVREIVFR